MKLPLILISSLLISLSLHAKSLLIEGNLDHWQAVTISGETQYQPIMDMEQGVVLRAESVNSASGFEYTRTINLKKTPVLQWQWTAEFTPYVVTMNKEGIETKIQTFDEQVAAGNDFVLRLVVSKKPLFGKAKSLHYVWSHSQPLESHWAIDENNQVLVVSGKDQTTMQWQTLHRHIPHDWNALFGEEIDEIDSIMFMTDTDAINGHAVGYYGDMRTLAIKSMAENN